MARRRVRHGRLKTKNAPCGNPVSGLPRGAALFLAGRRRTGRPGIVHQSRLCVSAQIGVKKVLQLVERNCAFSAAVIEAGVRTASGMRSIARQLFKSVLAEIAGAGLFPVHNQHGAADLVRMAQDGLVKDIQPVLFQPPFLQPAVRWAFIIFRFSQRALALSPASK